MSGIYVPVEKKPFDPICVAIDYDETISLNELAWMRLIKAFQQEGFKVIVVTYRPPELDPLIITLRAEIKNMSLTEEQNKELFEIAVRYGHAPGAVCIN